jgi:hypothetical protein
MARIDDYKEAVRLAETSLRPVPVDSIAARSGFVLTADGCLRVPFLNRSYRLSYPDFRFSDEADENREVPLQEQVLILHYLMAEETGPPSGRWIAYREIPGAAFYFSAFVKRAVEPLVAVFGMDAAGLMKVAHHVGGVGIDTGDGGIEVAVFPRVPLRLIVWEGDEEFAPEANILFDETVGNRLSPEDAAWAASLLVYRLMGLSKRG